MKGLRILKQAAIGLACLGVIVPQTPLRAATQADNATATSVADVALAPGGVLTGYVVDAHGVAVEGAAVSIQQGEQEIAQVVTDGKGRYTVRDLRGGLYQVNAGQGSRLFRFWAPNTAPPSAYEQAVVVSQSNAVRAQGGLVPVVGGVDFITLFIVAGVATGTTFAVLAYNEAKDNGDRIDQIVIPVSP